jgi:hypothetical protein
VDFRTGYVQVAPARQTIGLQVWVPKGERSPG